MKHSKELISYYVIARIASEYLAHLRRFFVGTFQNETFPTITVTKFIFCSKQQKVFEWSTFQRTLFTPLAWPDMEALCLACLTGRQGLVASNPAVVYFFITSLRR